MPGTCSFHEADFCSFAADLLRELAPVDLAFAIEAFVHAPSADGFLHEVSRLLRPGGALVIVDDVLAGPERTSRVLDEVRRGWHMQSLLSVADVAAAAAPHGLALVESVDLSPLQRLGRPRDRLIHALRPVLLLAQRFSPWAESLVGGDALQTAHRRGLLEYRLLRFERSSH
jgi:SAM-dependent methyltransferase